ncbi:MAG TPA: hypothetical protein VF175_03420 [Lacipirellula sp.]
MFRQRRARLATLAAITWSIVLAGSALAQTWGPPVGVDSYRFLPRRSIINQQGGIAGFDVDYRLQGTFDFRIHPSPLAVFPPVHVASFEKVEVVGVHPTLPDLDVDAALNLSGIRGGERLTNPRTPGLFHFQGKTADGSSVSLYAKVDGRWLYLRGRTTAPEGSADFFEYTIKALARRQPDGDFNRDGKVDSGDLLSWSSGATPSGRDLLAWQSQLGEEAPSIESLDASLDAALAAAATAAVSAVPEPASAALAMLAVAMLHGASRRRTR